MSDPIPDTTMKELRGVLTRWAVLLAVLGILAAWATWRMSSAAGRLAKMNGSVATAHTAHEPVIEHWTCTMHPRIQEAGPGDCPICGMELIPKVRAGGADKPGMPEKPKAWYRCTMPECGDQGSADPKSRCPVCGMSREAVDTGDEAEGEFDVRLGERARRLAEVATEPAEKRLLAKRIRTVGRVGFDETRYKMVSAWIGGRIDKLFADFTGMTVSKGDHLVEIYSPELLSAQEEYLQAVRSTVVTGDARTALARRSSEQVRGSARRKLELLGVTEAQIAAIERTGKPQTHLVVFAPIGGTILDKRVMEGMYVKTGDTLYTIADLTHLWLLIDLYESDLPWVKPFQEVRVSTRSLPGEVFTGEIVFTDPRVDPQSRTVPVRIHVENPAMRLKPDMWVTAEIDAALSRDGRGAVPAPRGDFACPMHPWETANEAGACPVCQMKLVRVDTLPQYTPPTDPTAILAVPRGAVMQTGKRALIYVADDPGSYHAVEVTIGPLAHDESGREYYPILSGLRGGEQVVTRGNFAIDSQAQLAGKPSLFAARGMTDHHGHTPTADANSDATTTTTKASAAMEQTQCPVMGGEVDKEVHTDFRGVRIYFCCPPCIEKFTSKPEKYLANLPESIQAQLRAFNQSDPRAQARGLKEHAHQVNPGAPKQPATQEAGND